MNQEEFDERLAAHRHWLSRNFYNKQPVSPQPGKQLILDNEDLSGLVTRGQPLEHAMFVNCNLTDMLFDRCTWFNASITRCTFDNTTISGSDLTRLTISECEFDANSLFCKDFSNVTIRDCDLSLAHFRNVQFVGTSFVRCRLGSITFDDCDLQKACWNHVTATYARLYTSNFVDAKIQTTDLSKSMIVDCDFRGASLHGSNLRDVHFPGSNLLRARFDDAMIAHANFDKAIGGNICRIDLGGWPIFINPWFTQIGCKREPNEDWLRFSPEDKALYSMDPRAASWWRVHGDMVKAAIRCVMAKQEERFDNTAAHYKEPKNAV